MTSSENELGDAGTVHATTTGSTSAEGGRAVQTALVVGASNDSYEQEADRVADHVMTTLTTRTTDAPPSDRFRKSANNRIRRMTSPTGEAGGAVDADTERAIASERSTGTQLPAATAFDGISNGCRFQPNQVARQYAVRRLEPEDSIEGIHLGL